MNWPLFWQSARRVALALVALASAAMIGVLGWLSLFESEEYEQARRAAIAQAQLPVKRDFESAIYHSFSENRSSENLVFSPLAIKLALAMLVDAADDETRHELMTALRDAEPVVLARIRGEIEGLDVLNRLWLPRERDPSDAYLKMSVQRYGVMPGLVDLRSNVESARARINKWYAERTAGLMSQLLPVGTLNSFDDFVLTSVAHLARGRVPSLHPEPGVSMAFTSRTGASTPLPVLRGEGEFGYAEDSEARVLDLPMGGGQLSMLIVLPKQRNGFGAVQSSVAAGALRQLTMRLRRRKVVVTMPPLDISRTLALPLAFSALGIELSFDPARADFSRLDSQRGLYLSSAVHRSRLELIGELHPHGDSGIGRLISAGGGTVSFRVDHPFIFLIRHVKTNTIVMMGHLVDPRD